jgi:hypothetical protein
MMSSETPDPYPGDPAGEPAERVPVASGDRREEVHFERASNQEVVARHLERPTGPLAPQGDSPGAAAVDADSPPIEDVAVAPEGPSVWDARPPADDAGKGGGPTGY